MIHISSCGYSDYWLNPCLIYHAPQLNRSGISASQIGHLGRTNQAPFFYIGEKDNFLCSKLMCRDLVNS